MYLGGQAGDLRVLEERGGAGDRDSTHCLWYSKMMKVHCDEI